MTHSLVRKSALHLIKRNFKTRILGSGSDFSVNKTLPELDNTNTEIANKQDDPLQHHFDTYILAKAFEKKGFTKMQAIVIMKGMKFKLRESVAHLHQQLLTSSDLENESYLIKAGMSELRTEVDVMRQKDTQALKSNTMLVTREVELLAQRMREEIDEQKNEIALEIHNRKNETRSDQKKIDMTIQELNNKFTVQLGEVRTSLESTRWETIWKGLAGAAGTGLIMVAIQYLLSNFLEKRAQKKNLQRSREEEVDLERL